MKRKAIYLTVAVIVFSVTGWGLHFLAGQPAQTMMKSDREARASVVDLDDVVRNPEKFGGVIGVEGRVTSVDASRSLVTLSCEDGDADIPVRFNGPAPERGSDVIAYGSIEKTEQGKYIFVAKRISSK